MNEIFGYIFAIVVVGLMGLLFAGGMLALVLGLFRFLWHIVKRIELLWFGVDEVARVVDLWQTGTMVNQRPLMRILLDVPQASGETRRVRITQLIDLGRMPRAGERVPVLVDPKRPRFVILRRS